jgi:flagellar biosynthesis chaperone FliJ
MNDRRQRIVVRKLEKLRSARLGLADLQLVRTRAAHEEAVRSEADAEAELQETIARSHEQFRELDQQLQSIASLKRETLYEWQGERKKVGAGVDAARDHLDEAKRLLQQQEEALAQAREKQRAATTDVERTRMMLSKMPQGSNR